MEKPLLRLTTKDFLTGVGTGAHMLTSGLFYKAAGITPAYDAGGTASVENGLLQPGNSPTDFSSGVVDNIKGGVSSDVGGTPFLYMIGSSGHFYKKAIGAGAVSDLRSATPLTSPSGAVTVWGPAGGSTLLYYWANGKIGSWNLSGSYPTGWNDTLYSTSTQGYQYVHKFNGNVYYGAIATLGAITDAGSGTAAHSTNVLDFPVPCQVGPITDDGRYLVVAVLLGSGSDYFGHNKIYFWDTFSSSWAQEFDIYDTYIWGFQRVGNTVFVLAQHGIYEVSIAGGVHKLRSELIGFGTVADVFSGYGHKHGSFNSALMFATDTTVDTFGKISPEFPAAYIKHFKIPSGVGTPSFLNCGFDTGRVYVATDGAKLYAYDFNGATRDTTNFAQTVYFPLPGKYEVKEIRVVFGEPLASGDSFTVSVLTDEDTSATSFGTATFSADGAIRRKKLLASLICEDQLSLKLTFTAGAVKVKSVEVYADALPT